MENLALKESLGILKSSYSDIAITDLNVDKTVRSSDSGTGFTNIDSKQSSDSFTKASEVSRSESTVSNSELGDDLVVNAVTNITITNKVTLHQHTDRAPSTIKRTPIKMNKIKNRVIQRSNISVAKWNEDIKKLAKNTNKFRIVVDKRSNLTNRFSTASTQMVCKPPMKTKQFDFSHITPKESVSFDKNKISTICDQYLFSY